ncbi:MAG TPA: hypothetical protein DCY20_11435 [Firmicutes bacterium]|nr:hypothetical protein [Bacillota bacterium]
MKFSKLLGFILVLSVVATCFVYPSLPPQIPTHWGINGEVDAMGPKSFAFFTAFLPVILYLLMRIIPKIDPRKDSYQKFEKAYARFVYVLMIFIIGLHWITLAWALGYEVPVDTTVKLGLGVLIIVLGNSLGQIRPNYTMGIKTPWTLASEKVWIKTHKVTSYYMVGCGIFILLTAFINGTLGFILSIGSLLVVTIGSIVYSYILYAREEKGKK